MVRICQPTVQIAHSVVGLVPKVQQVGVIDEACSNGERQLALKETDEAVDEGGRDGYEKPVDAMLKEQLWVLFDDGFHDPSIELSHVDGEERTRDEGRSVKHKKDKLFRQWTRN